MSLQPDRAHVDAAGAEDGEIDLTLQGQLQDEVDGATLGEVADAINIHPSAVEAYLSGTPSRATVVAVEMMANMYFDS